MTSSTILIIRTCLSSDCSFKRKSGVALTDTAQSATFSIASFIDLICAASGATVVFILVAGNYCLVKATIRIRVEWFFQHLPLRNFSFALLQRVYCDSTAALLCKLFKTVSWDIRGECFFTPAFPRGTLGAV